MRPGFQNMFREKFPEKEKLFKKGIGVLAKLIKKTSLWTLGIYLILS